MTCLRLGHLGVQRGRSGIASLQELIHGPGARLGRHAKLEFSLKRVHHAAGSLQAAAMKELRVPPRLGDSGKNERESLMQRGCNRCKMAVARSHGLQVPRRYSARHRRRFGRAAARERSLASRTTNATTLTMPDQGAHPVHSGRLPNLVASAVRWSKAKATFSAWEARWGVQVHLHAAAGCCMPVAAADGAHCRRVCIP